VRLPTIEPTMLMPPSTVESMHHRGAVRVRDRGVDAALFATKSHHDLPRDRDPASGRHRALAPRDPSGGDAFDWTWLRLPGWRCDDVHSAHVAPGTIAALAGQTTFLTGLSTVNISTPIVAFAAGVAGAVLGINIAMLLIGGSLTLLIQRGLGHWTTRPATQRHPD
jgi:hypothetical protein